MIHLVIADKIIFKCIHKLCHCIALVIVNILFYTGKRIYRLCKCLDQNLSVAVERTAVLVLKSLFKTAVDQNRTEGNRQILGVYPLCSVSDIGHNVYNIIQLPYECSVKLIKAAEFRGVTGLKSKLGSRTSGSPVVKHIFHRLCNSELTVLKAHMTLSLNVYLITTVHNVHMCVMRGNAETFKSRDNRLVVIKSGKTAACGECRVCSLIKCRGCISVTPHRKIRCIVFFSFNNVQNGVGKIIGKIVPVLIRP